MHSEPKPNVYGCDSAQQRSPLDPVVFNTTHSPRAQTHHQASRRHRDGLMILSLPERLTPSCITAVWIIAAAGVQRWARLLDLEELRNQFEVWSKARRHEARRVAGGARGSSEWRTTRLKWTPGGHSVYTPTETVKQNTLTKYLILYSNQINVCHTDFSI